MKNQALFYRPLVAEKAAQRRITRRKDYTNLGARDADALDAALEYERSKHDGFCPHTHGGIQVRFPL
jgi:uncharacterized protein (DUF952 family)